MTEAELIVAAGNAPDATIPFLIIGIAVGLAMFISWRIFN